MIRNISVYGIFLLSILFILGSILLFYKSINLQYFGKLTSGEVQHITKNATQFCGGYSCTFLDRLDVKYDDLEGKHYLSNISVKSADNMFKVGDRANIWYSKNNPSFISFDRGNAEMVMGIILFLLALLGFCYSYYLSKKNKSYWAK